LVGDTSTAMDEYKSNKKRESLKAAAQAVNDLNNQAED